MSKPRLFLCSGADGIGTPDDRHVVKLDSVGSKPNVNIRLENVTRAFAKDLSPRLVDLLEIAAYVYAADSATRRDGVWADDDSTEPWSRDLGFVIPVREPDFWNQKTVQDLLANTLQFLSDDIFTFEFRPLGIDRAKQFYLEIEDQDRWPFYDVERVIMFSGGLDSLAGALETAARGESLVLVSHRSVAHMDKRQRELYLGLQDFLGKLPMIRVPVWVNKSSKFGKEHTQRTRSFLFSALGTAVAESVRAAGVRFFENGVVSLNLPLADEVLRSRASRTTHPLSLKLLSELLSLVTGRDFVVDNPYVFSTKTEVVSSIAARGAAHLIGKTCSCAHTGLFQSNSQWHCGTCSQCIDRRIAAVASGQSFYDEETDYVSDVFSGPRKDGYEKNMAVDYARNAIEIDRMGEEQFATKFNLELSRAARCFPKQREAVEGLIQMHKRHARSVCQVLEDEIKAHAADVVSGDLEATSLLAMMSSRSHIEPAWERYAKEIGELLQLGLPTMCQKHQPANEPHLQQLCDGMLAAHDEKLIREFPYMRWSSSLTKPDWSQDQYRLWVEMKYIRKRADVHPITEAIASDITKYGDNDRRVLYVVYDPFHIIVDERSFSEPIVQRQQMHVCFVR